MRIRCSLLAVVFMVPGLRAQDITLAQVIIPGEDWRNVEGTFKPIRCLTSYSADVVNVWDEDLRLQATIRPGDVGATMSAGDGRIQIDRVAALDGLTLVLDRRNRKVNFERGFDRPEIVKSVDLPMAEPTALWAAPGQGTILIGDAASKYIWAFRIDRDRLAAGEKYLTVRLGKGKTRSETAEIRSDPAGRIFAATAEGVQVFDPTGRLCGVLSSPSRERITAMCFDGADGERLFIACGKEVYVRKINAPWLTSKAATP
jgi:hypothetical protein